MGTRAYICWQDIHKHLLFPNFSDLSENYQLYNYVNYVPCYLLTYQFIYRISITYSYLLTLNNSTLIVQVYSFFISSNIAMIMVTIFATYIIHHVSFSAVDTTVLPYRIASNKPLILFWVTLKTDTYQKVKHSVFERGERWPESQYEHAREILGTGASALQRDSVGDVMRGERTLSFMALHCSIGSVWVLMHKDKHCWLTTSTKLTYKHMEYFL